MYKKFFSVFTIFLFNLLASCNPNEVDILASIDADKSFQKLKGVCATDIPQEPEIEFINQIDYCTSNPNVCLKKCSKGDANYCFGLANDLQIEHVDYQYPQLLYAMSCKFGLPSGCTNHAAGLLHYEKETSEGCAAQSFEMTCRLNDPWGCSMYGYVLAVGQGVEENADKAIVTLRKTCELEPEFDACENATETLNMIEKAKSEQE